VTTLLVVACLAAYAVFLLWRVRVEKGRVAARMSFSELCAEFAASVREIEVAMGAALLPAARRAAEAFEAFARAWPKEPSE